MRTGKNSSGHSASRPRTLGLRYRVSSVLKKIGDILLKGGEFDAAALAFRCSLKLDPENIAAHISLSAYQNSRGRVEEARKTLETGIRNKPYTVRTCPNEPFGHALRTAAVDGGRFIVGRRRNKDYKIVLRGGNISDRYLLSSKKFSIINFIICDDNILTYNDIPEFDIIVNVIADPDVEARALHALWEFIGRHPEVPVINHPDRVLKTSRDEIYRRFKDAEGVLVPKTVRLTGGNLSIEGVISKIEENGFSFPVLIRETGTHTGKSLRKIDNQQDLERDFSYEDAKELYVTQYVENLFHERYFRKMRVFFIDGKIYPVVCHIDTEWNVHGSNRRELMGENQWMMDEEKSFMTDPEEYLGEAQYERVQFLGAEIGLDFFGLDFTVLNDGTILIFEMNPVMRHSLDHAGNFPYLTPYLVTISLAFERMMTTRLEASRTIK